MALKRTSEIQGGSSYFKPEEFKKATALLIEPKSIQRDVPNEYMGVSKPRDEVVADVSVFWTEADLAEGKAVEFKGMTFTHGGITNKLGKAIGDSLPGRMGKKKFPKSPQPAWVIDPDEFPETVEGVPLTDAEFDLVSAYYDAREAAVKAALADAPGFD